jgi:capsid protein
MKQRIAACFGVFITKQNPGSNGGNGLGRMPDDAKMGAGRTYKGKRVTPGMVGELGIGESVTEVNPGSTGTDAASFLKILLQLIGSAVGLSYEATARDLSNTNYSGARQANIEDDLTYSEEAELLKSLVLREVYETFLISCVLAGLLEIPGFWADKEKHMVHEFSNAKKRWIDPLKESRAEQIAQESGERTFQQMCAENGRDWRQQLEEIAEYEKYKENLNIGGKQDGE